MHYDFRKGVNKLKLKFPIAEISKTTEYSKGYVSELMSGKKEASFEVIKKMTESYDLSFEDFLHNGINESIKTRHIKLRQSLKDKEYMVYETNTLASAGTVEIINDEPNIIFDPITYGELNDVIGTVKASGNSMYPTLPPGSNVAVKRLLDKTLIAPSKIYLLIDINKSPFIKRLYECEDGVILKSDNKTLDEDKTRQYPDFKRKWSQILAIYEVKAVINLL